MFIRQKLLKRAYTDSVTNIVFIIVCKICFLLVFGSFSFERNIKYPEKVLRQVFRYVTDKILFTLQVYFARSVALKFSEYFSQF